MWKHSLKSRTEKYNDYGTRNSKQRNARDEATHLGHSGSKQTHSGDCPNAPSALRGEKSTLRGEKSANGFSSVLVPYRTIGTRALFPTPKSQGKSSIAYPTSTDYCKRIIGDRVSEVDDFLAISFVFLIMNEYLCTSICRSHFI